jgi:hypothetical protein
MQFFEGDYTERVKISWPFLCVFFLKWRVTHMLLLLNMSLCIYEICPYTWFLLQILIYTLACSWKDKRKSLKSTKSFPPPPITRLFCPHQHKMLWRTYGFIQLSPKSHFEERIYIYESRLLHSHSMRWLLSTVFIYFIHWIVCHMRRAAANIKVVPKPQNDNNRLIKFYRWKCNKKVAPESSRVCGKEKFMCLTITKLHSISIAKIIYTTTTMETTTRWKLVKMGKFICQSLI